MASATTSSSSKPIVVVTGGAGFIGSHTVDRLIEGGSRVIVLDNFSTGKRENLARWADRGKYAFAGSDPSLEIVVADVAHGIFAALAPLASFGRVERIIHLAAQVSVVHSVANPLVDIQTNYGGTAHVLEYARAHGIKKVVLASSAAIYGDVTQFPVIEDLPARPLSPYGIDKYASELALNYYSTVHGVPATSLRFFNVYGPRQDPSSPYSGVISIFADRARAGRDLIVFGDGLQTRDFVFVADVARAVVTAALSDSPAVDRAVMNVGTGHEITVRALADMVSRLCGGKSAVVHAPTRAGEISRSVASVERAKALLDFRSAVAFEDGLRQTLQWAGAVT